MAKHVIILETVDELRAHLSPAEDAAYLGDGWHKRASAPATCHVTTDEITMRFETPAQGVLNIRGGYEAGEQHFVIKLASELASEGAGQSVRRKLTLLGDAYSGVIVAMLLDSGGNTVPDKTIPQLDWAQIQDCLNATGEETVWQLQREGFSAFSAGHVTIPPVIYMQFEGRGDLHLKGAHEKNGDIYVFKIATAFPGNAGHGLPPSQGLMMAFDARTGTPLVVLKDEGHLTDLRTAIAGRNAAYSLMPDHELTGIGVLGTGVQARLQVALLKNLYPKCRRLTVWGRTPSKVAAYANEMTASGWDVTTADSPRHVADRSNLIITTTASRSALLDAQDVTNPNTLIIAIGADMPGKIELTAALLRNADTLLIDSIVQGKDHGNAAIAIEEGVIAESDVQEYGAFLNDPPAMNGALRIFLSSGIGVQDLKIVQAVIASCVK